ncbi:MAG: right-handed parallel beta-helix repeat-containing protein [Deltaproteobacteria bacterium]|nr:right-handed parallel beta-helix repeat-containing protein [Deltaproteobacteria bacterium]
MRGSKMIVVVTVVLLLVGGVASAREIHVDDDAAPKGKGSAARPLRSIVAALAVARSGDTIRVAAGRYRETLVLRRIKDLKLLGGYAPGFVSRDAKRYASRLVGDAKDAVVTILHAGKVRVEGFVISGGGGSGQDAPHYVNGGGVYVRGGQVTLRRNVVERNATSRGPAAAERAGGGIFATGGKITIVDNVVRHNVSRRGGGIAVIEAKTALIEGNRIEANRSDGDHGGGIYLAESKATVRRNVIVGNEVGRKLNYGWGGGVLISGKRAKVLLAHNTLRDNFAVSLGSGIYIDDEADATLQDELIVANRCSQDGGSAVYVDGLDKKRGSKARLLHCTVVNHPCKGLRGGEGVRVEQGSSVVVQRSVFWNNGDDFSKDKSSRLRVEDTLSRDSDAASAVRGKPTFVAAARGDYRLKAPAAAAGWGVRWGPTSSTTLTLPKKPALEGARPAERAKKVKASAPSPSAKEDCSIGGRGVAGSFALLLLLLMGRLRRMARQV